MSEARMCDRCGELYKEGYELIERPELMLEDGPIKIYKLRVYGENNGWEYSTTHMIDLCPKCATKFFNFMNRLDEISVKEE